MSHFEPGELALPIHRIIWAPDNDAHWNHLHVEGIPHMAQDELPTDGIWTPAIGAIFDALDARYGAGEHFIIDPDAAWTHMGVYNPRYIGGTTIWSQHAGANAIDIGPYYGVEEQQEFYDFLTRKEEDMTETQARIEVAVGVYERTGRWMTPAHGENAQQRLTRIAKEVAGGRPVNDVLKHFGTPSQQAPVNLPGWVLSPYITKGAVSTGDGASQSELDALAAEFDQHTHGTSKPR